MERSYNLGVLFKDNANNGLTHDYFSSILDNFKRTAEARGYDLSFMNCNRTRTNRNTYMEQVRHRKYDGVVIACIDFNDPEVIELINSDVPVVVVDQEMDNVLTVKSDNLQGIKDLVHYVGEMGHKRIAYILGDDNVVTSIRLQGFRDACAELGVEIPEEYIRWSEYRNMRKAAYETEQLLRLKNPPSCIFYPDDFAAIGGINVLRARGLDIPGDISITGYDGIHILTQYEPRLTTICQNTVEIGRISAEKLIECIENPDTVDRSTITVKTALEKGRTVGRVYY